MRISRIAYLASIVVVAVLSACYPAAGEPPSQSSPPESPLFTFMQFSDVHVGQEANRPIHKRLVAAVKLANALKPSFVINTGDMTTHPVYEASEVYLGEFDEYKRYIAPLTMPMYDVPGNHDIGYSDAAEGSRYEQDYDALVAAYEEKIGPLKQSFTYRGLRFILFNNNPRATRQPGHISQEQFDWLEGELERNEIALLFCHVQILEDGAGSPWGESAKRLAALCQRYRVAAVAYGHQHQSHLKTLHGTHYIMCPDLKMPDHQAVYQYRVFARRFELWVYDVFSQKGTQMASQSFRPLSANWMDQRPWPAGSLALQSCCRKQNIP